MKNTKTLFIVINILVLIYGAFFSNPASSADKSAEKPLSNATAICAECSELAGINAETLNEKKKKKPDFDSLQLRATALIQKMPDKDGKLTADQVRAIIAAFEASIANDPANAIVDNNIELLKANRPAFDREISKLPKKRADDLTETIQIVLSSDTEGSDPAP